MGVAVAILNPQDVLKTPSQNRSKRKPRRCPTGSRASSPMVEKPSVPLLTGNIKILKRGEDLPEATPDPPSPNGLPGPGPGSFTPAPNRVDDFYSGSSWSILSPPASSLPIPAFLARPRTL